MRKFKRWIRRALIFLLIAIILSFFPRTVLGAIPFLSRLMVSIFISLLHLFFFFWYLAGRVKIEVYLPGQLPYTWDDYRGHPEIVEQAKLWVELLKGASEFEKMGGRHIAGVLLEGAPGSGKTYLAKVLASEAGCAFINVSTNSLLGCVDKETLVRWRDGAIEIGKILPFLPEKTAIFWDSKFLGGHGQFVKTKGLYHEGHSLGVRIKTRRGFELLGTFNHPVLILEEEGRLVWKELADIKLGDTVCLLYNHGTFPRKSPISSDDALILGLLIGDGYLRPQTYLELINSNQEVVKAFKTWARKKGKKVISYRGKNHKIFGKDFRRCLFEEWGLDYALASEKRVPEVIWRCGRSEICAFLRGLFSADGYIDGKRRTIVLASTSEKLIKEVQLLLLELGIVSNIFGRYEPGKSGFQLFISSDVVEFCKRICFLQKEKIEKARRILEENLTRKKRHLSLPRLGSLLRSTTAFLVKCGILKWQDREKFRHAWSLGRRISRERLQELLQVSKNWEGVEKSIKENLTTLEKLLKEPFIFDTVKEKSYEEGDFWDLIETSDHTYFSGGFCSHNTFVGIGPLKVMTTFRKARRLARDFGACIIYLDEIDSIGRSRTGPQPETAGFPWGGWYGGGILNTLFIELDGLTFPRNLGWRIKRRFYKAIKKKEPKWPVPRILVIASTNIGAVLDPALTRPGRLSHRIVIEAPSFEGVKDILSYYLEKVEHDETVTVEKCGLDCIGQQPAKIAEAVNLAVAKAYARGAKKINYLDWRHALAEETLGLKQPVPWAERDRKRLSFHEAGHAVAVYLLFKGEHRITLASIMRYGSALGHISHVPFEQLYVYSRKELEKFLMVSLAGRAAEEVFLKEEMASMKGDMKHIQALILSMATQGFFKHLPKLDGSFTDDLQAEIETFISDKLKEVKDLLRKNQTLVSRLARELMEREEIIGEEVEKMLSSWEEKDERKD